MLKILKNLNKSIRKIEKNNLEKLPMYPLPWASSQKSKNIRNMKINIQN